MQFSKILFAVLPALVLAQDDAEKSTTTCTSSTTITKTMTLSEVHTVTSTLAHNTTTTSAYSTPASSVGTTSYYTSATVVPTNTDGGEEPPTVTEDPSAASALDATRVVLAGVLGMVVVAMI